MTATRLNLTARDLGRMPYAEAFDLQRRMHADVIVSRDALQHAERAFYVLLVEHDPPVITISKRKSAAAHLIATPQQLEDAGVETAETDRGGDITYHGPGQLVAYPILDLNALGLRLHGYMRLLEQVVIDTLAHFGIEGVRDGSATGVWVADEYGALSKICAMGVRVSRWVTMHGLALNVTTDLNHFNLIVPCGLADRGVTSMQQLLGGKCPGMQEVKGALIDRFREALMQRTADQERVAP